MGSSDGTGVGNDVGLRVGDDVGAVDSAVGAMVMQDGDFRISTMIALISVDLLSDLLNRHDAR